MIVKLEASKELIEAIHSLAHALNNLSASLNLEVEQAAEQEVARRMEEIKAEAATEKQTVSLEQVREKLAALAKAGKQEQVKELITSYGASKLTEIPEEKYAELLEKAEAIA